MSNRAGKCFFLLCDNVISQFKRSNLQRHHKTKQPRFSTDFPKGGELRAKKLARLKQNWTAQKNYFHINTSESVTEASYKITYELMKKMKPCTDGEIVKDCILLACSTLFPEKKDLERKKSFQCRILLWLGGHQTFQKHCKYSEGETVIHGDCQSCNGRNLGYKQDDIITHFYLRDWQSF